MPPKTRDVATSEPPAARLTFQRAKRSVRNGLRKRMGRAASAEKRMSLSE